MNAAIKFNNYIYDNIDFVEKKCYFSLSPNELKIKLLNVYDFFEYHSCTYVTTEEFNSEVKFLKKLLKDIGIGFTS